MPVYKPNDDRALLCNDKEIGWARPPWPLALITWQFSHNVKRPCLLNKEQRVMLHLRGIFFQTAHCQIENEKSTRLPNLSPPPSARRFSLHYKQ